MRTTMLVLDDDGGGPGRAASYQVAIPDVAAEVGPTALARPKHSRHPTGLKNVAAVSTEPQVRANEPFPVRIRGSVFDKHPIPDSATPAPHKTFRCLMTTHP